MKVAPVADLKNRLSHYLRMVAMGEDVTITDHGHPVARVTRVSADEAGVAGLVATGLARPPVAALPEDFLRRHLPRSTLPASQALIDDREDRF